MIDILKLIAPVEDDANDLARRVNVHWVEVRRALRMGQMAGLVELRGGAEGEWWWRG